MKRKIIIDSDTGIQNGVGKIHIDDVTVIFMALNSPNIDLMGITEVSGNVWAKQGVANALRLLEFVDRTEIPVCEGEIYPLLKNIKNLQAQLDVSGNQWFGALNPGEKGKDFIEPALGEMPKKLPHQSNAIDFLIEASKKYENELSLVCIGPLTNIAKAILQDPLFPGRIKEFLIMGGSFFEGGNSTAAAEFNFWWDAEAAKIVLRTSDRIKLFPLDICYKTKYTREQFNQIVGLKNKFSEFYKIIDSDYWSTNPAQLESIYDALPMMYLLHPEIFAPLQEKYIDVEDGSSFTYGQSLCFDDQNFPSNNLKKNQIAFEVDSEKFSRYLVESLRS